MYSNPLNKVPQGGPSDYEKIFLASKPRKSGNWASVNNVLYISEEMMVVTPEVMMTGSSSSSSCTHLLGGTQVERVKGKDYKVS